MWTSVTDQTALRAEYDRLRRHPLWPQSSIAALGDLLTELTTDPKWEKWCEEAMFIANGTRLMFQAAAPDRDAVDLDVDQNELRVMLDAGLYAAQTPSSGGPDISVYAWADKDRALAKLAEGVARWP